MVPRQNRQKKVRIIKQVVCQHTGVDAALLNMKTRKREVVLARQYCMYLLYLCSDMSLKAIGREFGGRDHSTVIHAKTTIQDLIDTYKHNRTEVEILYNNLKEYHIYKLQTNEGNYRLKREHQHS